MIVPVGTCSTLTTLPPLPCPNSCKCLRSSFFRLNSAAVRSSFASVLDNDACRPLLLAESTAESIPPGEGKPGTGRGGSGSGGGRLLGPGASRAGSGAGTGYSGAGGEMMATSGSWSSLKLRFVRRFIDILEPQKPLTNKYQQRRPESWVCKFNRPPPCRLFSLRPRIIRICIPLGMQCCGCCLNPAKFFLFRLTTNPSSIPTQDAYEVGSHSQAADLGITREPFFL